MVNVLRIYTKKKLYKTLIHKNEFFYTYNNYINHSLIEWTNY